MGGLVVVGGGREGGGVLTVFIQDYISYERAFLCDISDEDSE